jgi:hypothetical protein
LIVITISVVAQEISKGTLFYQPGIADTIFRGATPKSARQARFQQAGVVIRCERVLTDMSQDQWGSVCYLVASLLFAVWWRLRVEDEMRHQDNEDKDDEL